MYLDLTILRIIDISDLPITEGKPVGGAPCVCILKYYSQGVDHQSLKTNTCNITVISSFCVIEASG